MLKKSKTHEADHKPNRRISLTLGAGTAIGMLLLFAGLIMFFITGMPHTVGLTPISSIPAGLLNFNPAALVTTGLMVILAMPPCILVISLAHFISAHDMKLVIVCIILLIMLAASYVSMLK